MAENSVPTDIDRSPRERPLSPHLQIYKPQLVSTIPSILHRATGIALSAGTVLLVALLVSAATGPAAYDRMQAFLGSFIGQFMLYGWVWSFYYHLLAGMRHLGFDMNIGVDVPSARASAAIAIIGSVILTLVTAIVVYKGALS